MMADAAIPEDQQVVMARIAEAQQRAAALEQRRREVEAELASQEARREQFSLLDQICSSLDRLDELGASELFWGGRDQGRPVEHLAGLRNDIARFQQDLGAIEERRAEVQEKIRHQHEWLGALTDELHELRVQEELRQDEYVIAREFVPPYRTIQMPWSERGEDKNRLRKALLASLLLTLGLGSLVSLWTLRPKSPDQVEIPERFARLVQQELPAPVASVEQTRPEEPTPEEQPQEQVAESAPQPQAPAPAPTPAQRQAARESAQSAGVLAFRSQLSELRQSAPQARLGADARITDAGTKAVGERTQRALTAQAQGGSGGIDTASLSRDVGDAGRQGGGVEFARVESAIDAAAGAPERPRSDNLNASRTDEEIQIVFDRSKAALYRIYNRELRRDPTLRGKMVLRITIEPDGSVSASSVESTDLNSPALVSEILARVNRFNFGPKEGVPAVTILYPIDFLPAH